jgi:tetratricopeptide (TPR) repeat protein
VSARAIKILSVLAVLVVVGFVGYWVWFNYLQPAPSVVERSIQHIEDRIREDPSNPELRVAAADIYLANGMHRDAVTQYEEAIKVAEGHQGALLGLGRAHMALGDDDLAIDYFAQVIEIGMKGSLPRLDQKLEAALFYQGQLYLRTDRPQEAIDALIQAIALSPMDADAIYVLGRAYQEMGDHREAISRFNWAVQFIPDWTEAYQDMAVSYRALGDEQGRTYPDGMLALLRGDYEKAVQDLTVATSVEPENANAHWGLGAAYEMLQRPSDALAAYQAALAADSDHILAQAGAARLEQS